MLFVQGFLYSVYEFLFLKIKNRKYIQTPHHLNFYIYSLYWLINKECSLFLYPFLNNEESVILNSLWFEHDVRDCRLWDGWWYLIGATAVLVLIWLSSHFLLFERCCQPTRHEPLSSGIPNYESSSMNFGYFFCLLIFSSISILDVLQWDADSWSLLLTVKMKANYLYIVSIHTRIKITICEMITFMVSWILIFVLCRKEESMCRLKTLLK